MTSVADNSAQFQEVLFYELHHRFYNSLQLISTALGYLAVGHRRPDEVIQLQDRIGLLGGLHRTLSKPLAHLDDMQATLGHLCRSLVEGYGRGAVTLEISGANLPHDPMLARGLTLILVELVTNALKHGGSDTNLIRVILKSSAQDCRLTVTNPITQSTPVIAVAPYVATRFAEAMGGTLTVVSGREHEVCVTVPSSTRF